MRELPPKAKEALTKTRKKLFLSPPYYIQRHPLHGIPQYPKPPVQGELTGEADNQAAGKQGRPERQTMQRYSQQFCKGPPCQRHPGEGGNNEDKGKLRPQASSPLKILSHHNFHYQFRHSDHLKLPTADRQKQSSHQLRMRPSGRLRRAGLHKRWITTSTIWSSSMKKKHEIPVTRNEQKHRAQHVRACFVGLIRQELSALTITAKVLTIFTETCLFSIITFFKSVLFSM